MSNPEILQTECTFKNFPYDGQNLFTFEEWKKRGYIVKKGQKAFIRTKLWKKITRKNKQTGKDESFFVLTPAYLFTLEQVEKLSQTALSAK